jgi:pimeloyl-ACP methyl ester carboxylesterase
VFCFALLIDSLVPPSFNTITADTAFFAVPNSSWAQTEPPPPIGTTKPPVTSDTVFVSDTGGDLDILVTSVPTIRTLRFSIFIDRYFSTKSTSDAISLNLLPQKSKLILGTISSHVGCVSNIQTVRINGHLISRPSKASQNSGSSDEVWTIEFPTEILLLPISPGTAVSRPNSVAQLIEVDLPICTVGKFFGIDWGAIAIDTKVRPVVLVPGWKWDGSNPRTMEDFQRYLSNDGIPFAVANLNESLGPWSYDANLLATSVKSTSTKFGSRVNVYAHSRGGLVARYALNTIPSVAAMVQDVVGFSAPQHGVDQVGWGTWNIDLPIWGDLPLGDGGNCNTFYSTDPDKARRCIASGWDMTSKLMRDAFNYLPLIPTSNLIVRHGPLGGVNYWNFVGGQSNEKGKDQELHDDMSIRNTYPWDAFSGSFPVFVGDTEFSKMDGTPAIYVDTLGDEQCKRKAATKAPKGSGGKAIQERSELPNGRESSRGVQEHGVALAARESFSKVPNRADGTAVQTDNGTNQGVEGGAIKRVVGARL